MRTSWTFIWKCFSSVKFHRSIFKLTDSPMRTQQTKQKRKLCLSNWEIEIGGVVGLFVQFNSDQSQKVFKIQLSKLVVQFCVLGARKVEIFCHKVVFISRKKGSQHLYSFIFKHRDTQETLAVLDRWEMLDLIFFNQ